MAIISESIFTALIDDLAARYKVINECVTSLDDLSPTLFQIVTLADDPDVEVPIEVYADLADQPASTHTVIQKSFSKYLKLINSINSHFNRVGFAGGYDQYMIDEDIRASNYFNQMYISAVSQALLAKNVFCDDEVVFGSVTLTSGPTISYTDGVSFGNGTIANRRATDGNFAATRLKIVVVNFGAVQCDVNIIGLDAVGDVLSTSVTIPANTPDDTEINVGGSSVKYLDVGSVTFSSSNHGTSGDQFVIKNIIERVI